MLTLLDAAPAEDHNDDLTVRRAALLLHDGRPGEAIAALRGIGVTDLPDGPETTFSRLVLAAARAATALHHLGVPADREPEPTLAAVRDLRSRGDHEGARLLLLLHAVRRRLPAVPALDAALAQLAPAGRRAGTWSRWWRCGCSCRCWCCRPCGRCTSPRWPAGSSCSPPG